MKSKAERKILQDQLLALQEEVKATLLQLPNVVSVGVGLKEKNGKLTEEIVFQVFVREKIAETALDQSQIIPKEIKGFKTDVIILPKSTKRIDNSDHRPIKGGIQIGNGKGHVGTLGCFARLVADDTLVLLTNHHVLFSDEAVAGEPIGQPDISHRCCCCCAYVDGDIGIIQSTAFDNDRVDCAIATINSGATTDFICNNNMTTTELRMVGTDAAVVGDTVRKIGRTSGLTNGVVFSISGETSDKTGQLLIRPADTETFRESTNNKVAFSDAGDSGSIIINADNEIVGLLWGGDPDTFDVDETHCCHIADVLAAFRDAGTEIAIVFTPADRSRATVRQINRRIRLDQDIRQRLLETQKGARIVALFEKHQQEVLRLINTCRPVKLSWQRHHGPAFIAHLAKNVKDPAHIIPKTIHGIAIQELLIKMATVLKQHGSVLLKEDIDKHALWLIHETYDLHDMEEFMGKMEEEMKAYV